MNHFKNINIKYILIFFLKLLTRVTLSKINFIKYDLRNRPTNDECNSAACILIHFINYKLNINKCSLNVQTKISYHIMQINLYLINIIFLHKISYFF